MIRSFSRKPESLRLPPLSAEERRRSERVTDILIDEIQRNGGVIDFARFMEVALYAPTLGYYSSASPKFGESGDFVTAPELGNLFARCLARQIIEVFEKIDGVSVLEAGAGSGRLAADLLAELDRRGRLPQRYQILETSPALQAHQRRLLRKAGPRRFDRVEWLTSWPTNFRGVVIGNEFLDALPVRRFRVTNSGTRWLGVGWDGSRFVEIEAEAVDGALAERLERLHLPEGYASEWHPQAQAWVRSVAAALEAGVVFFVDYGFPAHEFYHADRNQGTLMCHYRHLSHTDPYVHVAAQDITAHLDFSAVADVAQQAGLEILGYTQQASFLLALGLTQLIQQEEQESTQNRLALTQQVKKLVLPSEMGELFKVIALGKEVRAPLAGFALSDHRDRL